MRKAKPPYQALKQLSIIFIKIVGPLNSRRTYPLVDMADKKISDGGVQLITN